MGVYLVNGGLQGLGSPIIFNRAPNLDVSGVAVPYALQASEFQYGPLKLTGVLTQNKTLHLPVEGWWIIWNATTGAFTVTVKTVAGAVSHVVAQGSIAVVLGDGAELRRTGYEVPTTLPALVQTYATADPTLAAYAANDQSVAYVGAADGEAKLTDLNALRVGYENLRALAEDLAKFVNSLVDDLQAAKIVG